MEQMTTILYICVAVPMLPVIAVLPEKKSKLLVLYFLFGMTICLIAGGLNMYILQSLNNDMVTLSTTAAPILEEVLKAIPVLYYALIFSDERHILLSEAVMTGIGFAILENITIIIQTIDTVTISWAVMRVIGATLMHAICTSSVGLGISYVRKRRKLFFCGTFALLSAAITFHAVFNVLVRSQYKAMAFILPSIFYLYFLLHEILKKRKNK